MFVLLDAYEVAIFIELPVSSCSHSREQVSLCPLETFKAAEALTSCILTVTTIWLAHLLLIVVKMYC